VRYGVLAEHFELKDRDDMSNKKVWVITGAGRGIGAEMTKAALAAGHAVVATGRKPEAVAQALGEADELVVAKLDVTHADDAETAVQAAVDRFGRVDVLVNNAGYGQLGFFEELSPAQIDQQLATNVIGAMNVTRAVLPTMRRQRAGHVITISSVSGLVGAGGASAYCASKFAIEGWMECLHQELAPMGIAATVVEPGFFQTDFLDSSSVAFGERQIDDYSSRSAEFRAWHDDKNQEQEGDPAKLAQALLTLAEQEQPPLRFIAGADAVAIAEQELIKRHAEIDGWRELSTALGREGAQTVSTLPSS
jgi:NAD(P)-dependent dehydrogenase (short-subunit alcohol dehydrogenase family)